MPTFLDSCMEFYGTKDLYDILSLDKTATDEDIKKAYRKLSLKVHPDRVGEDEKNVATEKFKILSKIHATLSDKDKRASYDESGCVIDDDTLNNDWTGYWSLLFKKITDEDIKNYEAKYRDGDEEQTDLVKAYQKFDGDIDMILDHVPFSHPDDIPRFQKILRPLVESGELPSHQKFFNEDPKKRAARKRKYKKDAKYVEKIQKENKSSLEAVDESPSKLIMQRRNEREAQGDAFFAHLEAKYANLTKKTKKNKK